MKSNYKVQLGIFGEMVAKRYYERQGYTLISRNFRIKQYELDLIFVKRGYLLFVEVKTRTYADYTQKELVSTKKLQSIKTAIYFYLQQNSTSGFENWDLELFSLCLENRKKPKVTVQPLLRGFG
jgi:putative endonuclease